MGPRISACNNTEFPERRRTRNLAVLAPPLEIFFCDQTQGFAPGEKTDVLRCALDSKRFRISFEAEKTKRQRTQGDGRTHTSKRSMCGAPRIERKSRPSKRSLSGAPDYLKLLPLEVFVEVDGHQHGVEVALRFLTINAERVYFSVQCCQAVFL